MLAADVVDSYLRDIAGERWLHVSAETRDIATKAKTRSKEAGGAYTVAERVGALTAELKIENVKISIALIELMSRWRNVTVHRSERPSNIDATLRQILSNNREKIAETHANLRIDLALKNFDARAVPVPKEVTSLIANAVRLCRSIDEAAIHRVASTPPAIEDTVNTIMMDHFEGIGPASARSFVADTWQGGKERRIKAIKKLLESLGISEVKRPVSHVLRDDFISDVADMSRDLFQEKYLFGGTTN